MSFIMLIVGAALGVAASRFFQWRSDYHDAYTPDIRFDGFHDGLRSWLIYGPRTPSEAIDALYFDTEDEYDFMDAQQIGTNVWRVRAKEQA